MSEYERVQKQLAKDEARYIGMVEAACVLFDRWGPFGLFRRWSPYARAYDAIMAEALQLHRGLIERRRREECVQAAAARDSSEVRP